MVRRNAFRLTLVTLALLGARTASADPINFTGFVQNDFPTSNTSLFTQPVDAHPTDTIAQLDQMTNAGIINGYAVKDARFGYDEKTDTLYVGLNTYSIAGSAVGNGGQAMDDILTAHGTNAFQDPAHIGGDKSITVGFAALNPGNDKTPGTIEAVAGVPSVKTAADTGLDHFTVASYANNINQGIQNQYGATLTNNLGALAFDPSAAHPNFEFSIANFSTIPGIDPTKGFWVKLYLGSAQDGPIGEESTAFFRVPKFAPQFIPEPTTWLAWSLVAGVGAFRLRGRSKKK